ncbi:unnamed protein product, partial [Ectocarpus sp. 12 AP-2014]
MLTHVWRAHRRGELFFRRLVFGTPSNDPQPALPALLLFPPSSPPLLLRSEIEPETEKSLPLVSAEVWRSRPSSSSATARRAFRPLVGDDLARPRLLLDRVG